jgi:hypothetical protein
VLGFYFSNYRVDDSLQARVAHTELRTEKPVPRTEDNADPDADGEPASEGELHYIVARVLFINAGNRPALVLGADWEVFDPRDREKGAFGGPAEVPDGTWPIIIKPRDIRLVDLGIPVKHLANNLDSGAPVSEPMLNIPGKSAQFNATITFAAVDSRGKRHDVSSEPFTMIEVYETGVAGISPLKEDRYPATSLFQSR